MKTFLAQAIFFTVLLSFFPSFAFAELRSGMDADIVIGQPDFETNSAGLTQGKLDTVTGIAGDGTRLVISDFTNNRVLIFNSIPKNSSAPADVVIGQTDFTTGTAGLARDKFNNPEKVFTDGRKLFVVDLLNSRVLIWNTIPAVSGAPADVVVGQPDFSTADFGTSAAGMTLPFGVFSDGKRLFVADGGNNRVLIFNSVPAANGAAADVILGLTGVAAVGRDGMNTPVDVFFDGKKLFVADFNNNRVLIWNSLPTQTGTPADIVLGQPDFESNTAGASERNLSTPGGVFSDGKSLFVGDTANHRVLIWKKIPEANFAPADLVLGQPNFTANTPGVGRRKMNGPLSIILDSERLFVGEQTNNRVTIFNLGTLSEAKLGPHFEQGKSVLGKVFEDKDGDGWQDKGEKGIEGVKVASDTGIYAITDEDGKYHFPFIETGQRLLKVDETTLSEGAILTTESPRKVVVTKGMLTKVSFGVRLPDDVIASPEGAKQSRSGVASSAAPPRNDTEPLLKVSISQDASALKPRLSVSALHKVADVKGVGERGKIVFTIDCNYFLLIHRAELKLYDQHQKLIHAVDLPRPLPLKYEIQLPKPLTSIHPLWKANEAERHIAYYQLSVFDKSDREDRTGIGRIAV